MGRTRFEIPRPKVRKGDSVKVRRTKVHQHKAIPEPTVEEGLGEFYDVHDAEAQDFDWPDDSEWIEEDTLALYLTEDCRPLPVRKDREEEK